MGVEPLEGEDQGVGGEALHLDLAEGLAVHRVGARGAERLDVEMLGAASHLLVRGEGDPHLPVRDLGVGDEPGGGGDDLRHPRLVVGAEERGSRGGHDVVADLLGQVRVVGVAQDRGRVVRQHQVLPLVVPMDDRLHPGARHLRRGVDVGDEADHRHLGLRAGGRDRRRHVAPFVDRGIGQAERAQLVDERPQEVELFRGGGVALRLLVRLGVDLHVAQEALQDLVADLAHRSSGNENRNAPGISRAPLVPAILSAGRRVAGGRARAALRGKKRREAGWPPAPVRKPEPSRSGSRRRRSTRAG
ncbi:MAG: hypothetical protein BWX64_02159 [Acidobacteria bacterium ADurb.Bin051]|nr:MAG: hypothetical protein BWX64_02159 [Acidobacteria bacterium ADurb.Bin051]